LLRGRGKARKIAFETEVGAAVMELHTNNNTNNNNNNKTDQFLRI